MRTIDLNGEKRTPGPCIFCGHPTVVSDWSTSVSKRKRVKCLVCEALGPAEMYAEEAVSAWERARATHATPVPELVMGFTIGEVDDIRADLVLLFRDHPNVTSTTKKLSEILDAALDQPKAL